MTAHRERLPRGSSAGPGVVFFSLCGEVVDRICPLLRTFFPFIKPPPLLFSAAPSLPAVLYSGRSKPDGLETGKGGTLTDRSAALIGPRGCGSFRSPVFRRRIFRFIKKPDEIFSIRHRCPFDRWAPWGAPPSGRGALACSWHVKGNGSARASTCTRRVHRRPYPTGFERHRQNERRDQPGTNRQGPFQEQGGPLKLASGIALPSLAEAM